MSAYELIDPSLFAREDGVLEPSRIVDRILVAARRSAMPELPARTL
jgi:hypothetical protein